MQTVWHILQLLSLSLSWIVAHLCFTETRNIYEKLNQQLILGKEQIADITQKYQQEQVAWDEQREAFQKEITRLIEEAEQRHLETEQQAQYALLMRSEIDLLTEQKEDVIRSEQMAQQELALKNKEVRALRAATTQVVIASDESQKTSLEDHGNTQAQKERCGQLTQQLLELQQTHLQQIEQMQIKQDAVIQEDKSNFAQQLEVLREKYEQKLRAVQEICSQQQDEQEVSLKHSQQLEELSHAHAQQLGLLKQEYIQHIEQLKYQQQQAIQAQQEHCVVLQQQLEAVQITQAEQECKHSSSVSRDLAKVEGLHKQLRMQFEEKSRVLDQTRRQLFKIEGALELVQRDEKNRTFEEAFNQENQFFIATCEALQQELDAAETQIQDLESLVTICFHAR